MGTISAEGTEGAGIGGKLEGKVAVITGGDSGIGLAAAQRLVADGAYVFITRRRQRALELCEQMLPLYPDRVNPGALWSSARALKG